MLSDVISKEIQKSDDKIRALGIEINSLEDQKSQLLKKLTDINSQIAQAEDRLSGIDKIIDKKNADFESSKIPVNKALDEREKSINAKKGTQDEKEKTLKEKDALLTKRESNVNTQKISLINHLKEMSSGITQEIADVMSIIEGQ